VSFGGFSKRLGDGRVVGVAVIGVAVNVFAAMHGQEETIKSLFL
jgi:hypothetical protein